MQFVIYALPAAALALFLKQERQGIWGTIWPCLAGFALGCCIAIGLGSYVAGKLAIDMFGVTVCGIAMIITALVSNRDFWKRRPSNDLRD